MRINNNFEGMLPLYKEGMILALLILLVILWVFLLSWLFGFHGTFFESFFIYIKQVIFLMGRLLDTFLLFLWVL